MPWIFWGPVLLAAFYAFMAWRVSGMRKPGVIVSLYEPPPSLSPAAVRYAVINGTDGKTIAASLASLVCKGLITLTRTAEGFQVKRTVAAIDATLPYEEKVLMDLVFGYGDPNVIAPSNSSRMDGMVSGMEGALLKQFKGVFNTGNYGMIAAAVVLSIVWALAGAHGGTQMFVTMWGTCFSLVLFAVLWVRALPAWKDLLHGRLRGHALFGALVLMPLPLAMAAAAYFAMSRTLSAEVTTAVLLMTAINVVGGSFLRAPTSHGRTVLDQIEGYRQFLLRAEQDRLDRLTDLKESSRLDSHMPYAIALDIKEAWGDHLCDLFSSATVAKG
jgi:hypothetical protein